MKIEDDLSVIESILGYGAATLVCGMVLVVLIFIAHEVFKGKRLKIQWKRAMKELVGVVLLVIVIIVVFHILLFVLGLPVYGIVELFK